MALVIRAATPEDAESIARAFCESAEHHTALDPERYFVESREAIAARYRAGEQHRDRLPEECVTLVAELAGEVAGFVDARLERPADGMHRDALYCYIAEIAVRRALRSRGIGAALMRAAEEWGRCRGAEFAYLEYNAANTRAGAFYRDRLGYRVASFTALKRLLP